MIVAVETDDMFSQEKLHKLKELHEDLSANVKYIKSVDSLVNAKTISGDKNLIEVSYLIKDSSEKIEERIMTEDSFKNFYYSSDKKLLMLLLQSDFNDKEQERADLFSEFDDLDAQKVSDNSTQDIEKKNAAYNADIDEVIARYATNDFKVYVTGQPRILNAYFISTNKNLKNLSLWTIAIIAGALLLLFRRMSGILIPFANVTFAIISTFGLMALLEVKITVVTQVLSSFLLAVGIGDSVHVLTKFYRYQQSLNNKKKAIVDAFQHTGLAIFMTSITTAAGLLSFLGAGSPPVKELGVFASFGVMMSLFFYLYLHTSDHQVDPSQKKDSPSQFFCSFYGSIFKILFASIP